MSRTEIKFWITVSVLAVLLVVITIIFFYTIISAIINPYKIRLAWKNLINKPLSMVLSLTLFALGVGLISLLLLLNKQVEDKFDKNLAKIDLVIGAKGSPLQLILCSMYHIDAPTGNISLKEARPFLNPKHPLIDKAIPLSLGDSHKGYRIVGTTKDMVDLYNAEIARGNLWAQTYEVTVGAAAAEDLGLKIGDSFHSSHGFVIDDNLIHDDGDAFKVVGILKPTGAVIDQLILTNPQSIWHVHDHGPPADLLEEEEEEQNHDDHEHDHEGHDHEGHDHGHDHAAHQSPPTKPLIEESDDKEITSLLLLFKKRNYQTLNMQRSINENTDMQAATPAIEINRLHSMMGVGEQALQLLALIIIIVSGVSIFISLYNSLKERKYELSLMRVMGASPGTLFTLVILEGLMLAFMGCAIGLALSHVGMEMFSDYLKEAYRYAFSGWMFLKEEGYLILAALGIGTVAAVIPALQAFKTDISKTLTES